MKLMIMIIFGLLVLSVFALFGNNIRCLAATGDCPGFCRNKNKSCNSDTSLDTCVFENYCRAPGWLEYRDDFEAVFKKIFKL
ncbi:hypothetical protein COT94_02280 [Candidatus Falkowbacteria bacterium CG10_big_fil_rev_8_21_14_0_10_37_14]|uniref:Uncharacterized protein n=1 Tax=Candidatus Falkowbacteria bacterium CG10_big_fil_rev_8_21_14_0_10_37_14 TaxID=1974561 RepID=A0A2M6WTF6_9BACT|nr:hypothetical protein [Candidatus Falkowbacteria bacterium]PIT96068.1 MAG: hypothetical protein COT94_02280 [Candidatus Falkowbacteria bacterium CG10_big_fil_rev_8_21_14_0_10_37_14]